MNGWNRYSCKPLLVTVILGIFALVTTACSGDSPTTPTPVPLDMSQTLERILEKGPQLQQQLDNIEKYHPDLGSNCSSAYPESCIPPSPPDLDCKDIAHRNFLVLPPDPHKFDPDKNGIGCEGPAQ